MGETTTTTTIKEEETEEESASLELALDALRSANEEILEKGEEQQQQERREEGCSSNATSKFDLLEKVLAKFTTNTTREDEDEKTGKKTTTFTQKKKKIHAAKDVASEFSRKWTREHALFVWSDYNNGKDSGKGWYEKECFLADVALTVNDYWLQNGLQMEFPLFAEGSSGTSKEDGEDIFSWKCAKISLNNVKAFVAVVMNWPKGKKTSGQNLIEDLKRVREKGLAKKGCKKPLRTYEQCIRQIAWVVREASEGVMEDARKRKGVSGKEKKEGLEEARAFERELRSYVEQSWMENGLPTLPERWYEKRGGELSEEEEEIKGEEGGVKTEKTTPATTPAGKRAREEDQAPKSTAKKQKTTTTPAALEEAPAETPPAKKIEYKRETSLMKKIYDADAIDDDALLKRLPEPMRIPNEIDRLIAVTLRVRCHGLDADVALIPPNPPTNGFKTSAEMAELLAEAAIGPESSTIPAADNINETCPTEPWIPGRGNRCLRNDGKLWRCSFKACDEDGLFCRRHADVAFGKNLSSEELEKEAKKQRDKTVAKYQGLPATVVVLSVGKVSVSIDAPGGARLCDPEIFEEHAFRSHCGVANAGGKFIPRKKITDLDANAEEGDIKKEDADVNTKVSDDVVVDDGDIGNKNMGNEFFRANARVREREGAWTNFREYEHKLLSNIPAMTPGASVVTQESQVETILRSVKYANEKRKVAILEALKTNNTRDKNDPTILSVVGGKTPKKMQRMLDVNAATPSPSKEDEEVEKKTEEKKPSNLGVKKESTPPSSETRQTLEKQRVFSAVEQPVGKDAELIKLYNESVLTRDSMMAAKIARDAARKESGVNSEDCQLLTAQIESLEDSAMALAKKLVMRISTLGLNISLSDLETYCTQEDVVAASPMTITTPQANTNSPQPMESPKPSVALSIINSIKGEGQELDHALENLRECCASLTEVSRTTKAMQQSAIDHVSNSRRIREEERKVKEEKDEENKGAAAQEPSYYANYATSIEHALVCAAEMTRHTS